MNDKMPRFDELSQDFNALWNWLKRAPNQYDHIFRHPTLITVSTIGPRARTMVLRDIVEDNFIFYTDRRSDKMNQLFQEKGATLHAYDRTEGFQVQAYGQCKPLTKHPLLTEWKIKGLKRFEDYGMPMAPGTPLGKNSPPDMLLAKRNFMVLAFEANEFECLKILKTGNQRMKWTLSNGSWTNTLLTP